MPGNIKGFQFYPTQMQYNAKIAQLLRNKRNIHTTGLEVKFQINSKR